MSAIVICGSRKWVRPEPIRAYLESLDRETLIVHGDQGYYLPSKKIWVGADKLAAQIARELGFETKAYPADWERYGLRAGPIRNLAMVEAESPERVVAFRLAGVSKGTDNMLGVARRYRVPTTVFLLDGDRLTRTDRDRPQQRPLGLADDLFEAPVEAVKKKLDAADEWLAARGLTRKDLTKGKSKR